MGRKPVYQSNAEKQAAYRQRQRELANQKAPLAHVVDELRDLGHEVPQIYDARSEDMARRLLAARQRIEGQADRLNARLADRVADLPEGPVKARLVGELARQMKITVKVW